MYSTDTMKLTFQEPAMTDSPHEAGCENGSARIRSRHDSMQVIRTHVTAATADTQHARKQQPFSHVYTCMVTVISLQMRHVNT